MGPGQDKAFLKFGSRTLIEQVIQSAKNVADDVFIVGPKGKFSAFGRIVEDVYPDCGPLGGLHAALSRSRTDLNLMLPVDTPFISSEFLLFLTDQARSSTAMITVPRVNKGLQPLCAVYRREFLPISEAALKAGKYKIDPLFPVGDTLVVEMESDAVKHHGFDLSMFDNINSPEDYERAAKRAPLKRPARRFHHEPSS
jgi:molybdopterin-guanine dinucleotide biosynthesis protein A